MLSSLNNNVLTAHKMPPFSSLTAMRPLAQEMVNFLLFK